MKTKQLRVNRDYPILYLLPAFAVLFILIFLPLVTNIVRSFSVKDAFPTLENYVDLFHDKQYLNDLKNTFLWLLYTLPFEMILGLFIAVLLNMKIKGRKIYRTMFIIPWVLPASVVCIIWKWMYNADYGILKYEDGICYYTYWIRHADDGDPTKISPMEYAIVRNNIYQLDVRSISGIGSVTPIEDAQVIITVYVVDWKDVPTIPVEW